MDDLMAKLQDILNSSAGQESLKQIAGMLGGGDGQLDLGNIGSLLGQNVKQETPEDQTNTQQTSKSVSSNQKSGENSGGFNLDGLDIGSILKVQNIMKSMKQDDKNTALIRALRPHLKRERRHRVDEALRLMQLISILPALRESGLLEKLFGGDS